MSFPTQPNATATPQPDHMQPFAPPPGYAFEPELPGEPPRPIPAEVRQGRHATRQRRTVWGFLFAGMLLFGAGQLPILKTWGLYILPLQYLSWIGVGCVAIALVAFLANLVNRGPYRYVAEG